KTTLGLTCKREIGENLSGAVFCESSEEKKGSVAKLRTTFCYIQHVAILILGKLTMEYDPKISRQNLLGAHALLQAQVDPLQVPNIPEVKLMQELSGRTGREDARLRQQLLGARIAPQHLEIP